MNTKILNIIIILSIVGILGIAVREQLLKKTQPSTPTIQKISPSPLPTQEPEDSEVACNNPYFNFKKGTTWKYKLNSKITSKNDTDKSEAVFQNIITEASASSVLITTKFEKSNKEFKTKLTCRKSGIYGFPLLTQMFSELVDTNIRLFPPYKNNILQPEWKSIIKFNLGLPLFNQSISYEITHRIKEEKKQQILGGKAVNTIIVSGNISSDSQNNQLFEYTLAENIGIIDFELKFEIEGLGGYSASVELMEYK